MMNNKIPFYQVRSFGEKFNVVFSFIKQNWRYMIRYILYGVLPLSLLAALSVDSLMSSTMVAVGDGPVNTGFQLFGSYIFLSLVFGLVGLWVGSVVFSCMQIYNERENGLEDITFNELKPYVKRNAGRIFKFGLVGLLVLFVVVAILIGCVMVNVTFYVIAFLSIMALCIPFLMVLPTYIYEDISVWQAYARGLRLGWNTWGGIFALGFVLVLITNALGFVFSLPWQVALFMKALFGYGDSYNPSIIVTLIQYIFGVVMWVGQFTLSIIFIVSISYLYSHAAEQQDDMSVAKGIDNFEGMADENPDDEELFQKPEPLV
nr:hypothetical protein [uncultured Prevotella sp.]